jgi:hypothetical protein
MLLMLKVAIFMRLPTGSRHDPMPAWASQTE